MEKEMWAQNKNIRSLYGTGTSEEQNYNSENIVILDEDLDSDVWEEASDGDKDRGSIVNTSDSDMFHLTGY